MVIPPNMVCVVKIG